MPSAGTTLIKNATLPAKLDGHPALECLQKLHAWSDYTYTIVRNKRTRRQQLRIVFQCDRCESLRVEMATLATGDRIGGLVYHHSEGYKLAKGERMTPKDRNAIKLYRASKAKITIEETT